MKLFRYGFSQGFLPVLHFGRFGIPGKSVASFLIPANEGAFEESSLSYVRWGDRLYDLAIRPTRQDVRIDLNMRAIIILMTFDRLKMR